MTVGIVAIGRNEGERFRRCLRSLGACGAPVVYVDSGSTDGSVAFARSEGASVVELETSRPFTAARARNAGFEKLLAEHPALEFVQFIDGDCELDANWLPLALQVLRDDAALAVVCGRRREAFPRRSIYNELCDVEWDTPIGEATSCGGDALVRVTAFRAAGGFAASLIAGEEPELCVRLRRLGFRIRRLPGEMTRHDAAMTSFRQWWQRTLRSGHAFAEGAALHGRSPERHWVRETRSVWLWGLVMPVGALVTSPIAPLVAAGLLAAYPLLALRIWCRRRKTLGARRAALFAAACVVGKFPQMLGAARFAARNLVGGPGLIEYKSEPSPGSRRDNL